jgi:hypothetical protein
MVEILSISASILSMQMKTTYPDQTHRNFQFDLIYRCHEHRCDALKTSIVKCILAPTRSGYSFYAHICRILT